MKQQTPNNHSRAVRAFLLASMLHFAISPAIAQEAPAAPSKAVDFSKSDLNKDGYIDKSEATSPELSELLVSADTNGDGRVSTVEFGLALEKKAPLK